LQGDHAVNSWAPAVLPEANSSTLERIARLYENDAFLEAQFESAMKTRAMADDNVFPDSRTATLIPDLLIS
jgi:hypothetical protein